MKTQPELTKKAYLAARDAIVKTLGKDANNYETLLDVALLLVHYGVTNGGRLAISQAAHNVKFFIRQLAFLVKESQKNVDPKTLCGREM